MAFDFPNSPTTGQVVTTPVGLQYSWDGVKWVASGSTSPQNWAPAGAMGNAGRNFIHNSRFNIQQRGVGPWTANGFLADRWQLALSGDTVSASIVLASDAIRAAVGDEACQQFLSAVITGNSAVGSFSEFTHAIENVRRLAGKTVTLSFWAWTSVGTAKLGLNGYQNFGTGGSPSAPVSFQATGSAVSLVDISGPIAPVAPAPTSPLAPVVPVATVAPAVPAESAEGVATPELEVWYAWQVAKRMHTPAPDSDDQ